MRTRSLRIATRSSQLALWQSEHIRDRLKQHHPELTVEIVPFKTQGDKILDVPLAKIGGKGLFTKELELALLSDKADIAVHSMKDIPADLPEGLHIGAVPAAGDPRDAFVCNDYPTLNDLPQGARLGTSSLRRQSQLLHHRPDLKVGFLRGNVGTRLSKLDAGDFDAIVLAAAGLRRLGLAERIRSAIEPDVCLPAVGQGVLAIECRIDDEHIHQCLAPLQDTNANIRIAAERAFSARLEGGCQVPMAGHAVVQGETVTLRGLVARPDGSELIQGELTGPKAEAKRIGVTLAERLLDQGAGRILAELDDTHPSP
ncbi:MAG: hydroxymethylbilane synthase [Pseudomonadota bacterium]|nr:hydroxymethylbilane synthase [Pseudomonadota bacterium]